METYRITHLATPGQDDITQYHGTFEGTPPNVHTVCGKLVSPFSCVDMPNCDDCFSIYVGAPDPDEIERLESGEWMVDQDGNEITQAEFDKLQDPIIPAPRLQRFIPGDRVRIESHGCTRVGEVTSAQNFPGPDGQPDWYIEMIDDENGNVYWKQGQDGGTIELLNASAGK
jgi:hypothetical protein